MRARPFDLSDFLQRELEYTNPQGVFFSLYETGFTEEGGGVFVCCDFPDMETDSPYVSLEICQRFYSIPDFQQSFDITSKDALDRITPYLLLDSFYHSKMEIFCMIDYIYSGGVFYFRSTKQGLFAIDRGAGLKIPVEQALVTADDYIAFTSRYFM